jgi:hypothetical protein
MGVVSGAGGQPGPGGHGGGGVAGRGGAEPQCTRVREGALVLGAVCPLNNDLTAMPLRFEQRLIYRHTLMCAHDLERLEKHPVKGRHQIQLLRHWS